MTDKTANTDLSDSDLDAASAGGILEPVITRMPLRDGTSLTAYREDFGVEMPKGDLAAYREDFGVETPKPLAK